MFSARLPWDSPENRLTRALRERRAAGLPILDLSAANPTRAGLFSSGELGDLLAPLADPAGLRYAPDPAGLRPAREAVAGYYADRGLVVAPDDVVLCASTSEGYSWLFQVLCDPGDGVLVPQPSYPLFSHLLGLAAARPVPYALDYDGRWRAGGLPLEEPTLRALLCVSPSNPTGSYLHRGEHRALDAACAARGLALITDEVFGDYPLDPALLPYETAEDEIIPSLAGAETQALTLVLSGLSKVLGLPQLKLAWVVVGGPAPLRARARERLLLVADTFLSVSTPVQLAAAALLRQRPLLQGAIHRRVRDNLAVLKAQVRGTACDVLRCEGGWYAVLRVPRLVSDEDLCLRLLDDGVLCHPGFFFDFPSDGHLVLSLLPPPQDFAAAVALVLGRVARLTAE